MGLRHLWVRCQDGDDGLQIKRFRLFSVLGRMRGIESLIPWPLAKPLGGGGGCREADGVWGRTQWELRRVPVH
jgi:hypothetical protein